MLVFIFIFIFLRIVPGPKRVSVKNSKSDIPREKKSSYKLINTVKIKKNKNKK